MITIIASEEEKEELIDNLLFEIDNDLDLDSKDIRLIRYIVNLILKDIK